MSYHVYENWVAEGHKARVHRSTCSFCNNGRGVHPGSGTRNGAWHGPFDTLEEAMIAAIDTGGNVSSCKVCLAGERPSNRRV